ncbi:Rieske (2Fe-2S) protein [Actinomyces sp. HMSC065F11]|uniref:Rieske (2Fe-2S) protein n=1 Tax=Actinomyces sp. HMSC065F11 TaxID=1739395 RepID=UPI0008A49059|nr:Rieske 2Fe-2S domain-containing protein [Actinomyces sp. HMSC065F11]OFR32115.1 nitrite reductase [Actinomyces sp. HMSC065F11]
MSFQVACPADLEAGQARMIELTNEAGDELPIAIIRDTVGDWYAIDDTCPHADVSLSEGDISQACVECWAHSAEINLKTGEATLPVTETVRTYPVKLEGQNVLVDLEVE